VVQNRWGSLHREHLCRDHDAHYDRGQGDIQVWGHGKELEHGMAPAHGRQAWEHGMVQVRGRQVWGHGKALVHGKQVLVHGMVQVHGRQVWEGNKVQVHGKQVLVHDMVQVHGRQVWEGNKVQVHGRQGHGMAQVHGKQGQGHGMAQVHGKQVHGMVLVHGRQGHGRAQVHGKQVQVHGRQGHGMAQVFGMQVGNRVLVDGRQVLEFHKQVLDDMELVYDTQVQVHMQVHDRQQVVAGNLHTQVLDNLLHNQYKDSGRVSDLQPFLLVYDHHHCSLKWRRKYQNWAIEFQMVIPAKNPTSKAEKNVRFESFS
jgi:hypothetical protein